MISAGETRFEGIAHGRVNLIGEHTDYNGGWVLPTAIPQRTRVTLVPRADLTVRVEAAPEPATGRPRKMEYTLGREEKAGDWGDYLRGATHFLLADGQPIRGFTAWIESNVPEGSGLSSSAALEIAFLNALTEAFSLKLDGIALARLGQRIENDFVGARVGIMDQMACTFARAGEALFLDTQTLRSETVALPVSACDLIVLNSGVAHRNAGGDYNQRRAECEDACARLGISLLRELGADGLARIEKLPDVPRRRARHVFTENARVHAAVKALRTGDLRELGQLFYASHASMRDDYAVSIPEIDLLVELCRKEPDVFGARLTGGGFGGSIVAICGKGRGFAVGVRIAEAYRRETRENPVLLVPESAPHV